MNTDITVAQNRINDLGEREKMLIEGIEDVCTEKRRVDKYHDELQNRIDGKSEQGGESAKDKEKNE
jgi:hypothetical protein